MPAAAGAVAAAAVADQMLGPKEDRHLAIVLVLCFLVWLLGAGRCCGWLFYLTYKRKWEWKEKETGCSDSHHSRQNCIRLACQLEERLLLQQSWQDIYAGWDMIRNILMLERLAILLQRSLIFFLAYPVITQALLERLTQTLLRFFAVPTA